MLSNRILIGMGGKCKHQVGIDFGDTKLTSLRKMFDCISYEYNSYYSTITPWGYAKSIDLSGLDVSQVTDVAYLFTSCSGLTKVDLSSWSEYSKNFTDTSGMFNRCISLEEVNLNGWDFTKCNVTTLFDSINTKKMKNLYMNNCNFNRDYYTSIGKHFTYADINNVYMNNCIAYHGDFSFGFSGTSKTKLYLQNLKITGDFNGVERMFENCWGLSYIDLTGANFGSITRFGYMFMECYSLEKVDFTNSDLSKAKSMHGMFSNCSALTEVRMSSQLNSSLEVGEEEYDEDYDEWYDSRMFAGVETTGKFYYNAAYNYSKIINILPYKWTAIPCNLTNGVLIPK